VQLQQAMLDVSKLTKSLTEKSKSQKKPEASNEGVAFQQNPQPDPSRPLRVNLMAEYDHRIGQNMTHLSPPWKIQRNEKHMDKLKAMVKHYKIFKEKWPDIDSKAKLEEDERQRTKPPPEVLQQVRSARSVIRYLKCKANVDF